MNSFVKTLLTILSVIGLIAWGGCVFVGAHFASDCSWPVSVSAGVGTALLMGFFYFLACHYSRPDSQSQYGSAANTKKWVFISIYAVVAVVSAWYVLHAVGCFTTYKEEIQNKAGDEFAALRAMTGDNSPGGYMEYVDLQLTNYRTANPNHLTDNTLLDKEVDDLYDLYITNSEYPQLKEKIRKFGEPASWAVENWDILTVSSYLHELDKKKAEWDAKFVECSKKGLELAPAQLHEDYKPLDPTYKDLAKPLLNPSGKSVTMQGIVTLVVLQILILLNWFSVFVTTRQGATGIKSSSPYAAGVGVWNPVNNQPKAKS